MKKDNNLLFQIQKLFKEMEKKKPIVHCITNFVTVNDCANALLAINACPIMTSSKKESEEVTNFSNSLLLNIGTLNDDQIESMILAGKKAKYLDIPIIFDPVGCGSTSYRVELSNLILNEIKPDIIRGNLSEIKSLINNKMNINKRGVDVTFKDKVAIKELKFASKYIQELSNKTNSIVISTGKIDIINYNETTYYVLNGHESLCKITGSGCMLSSLIAGYSGLFFGHDKINLLKSSVLGTVLMGISGEKAAFKLKLEQNYTNIPLGTFHSFVIDNFCLINNETILNEGKIYS